MAVLIEMASPALRDSAGRIRLAVFDVDGVLTDGRFTLDKDGNESKTFNTQDGYGLRRLIDAGVVVAIITGRNSAAVDKRMAELGVSHVFQGCSDKGATIAELMRSLAVEKDEAAAIGDDLPDLQMFEAVGLRFAVANAVGELVGHADLTTRRGGGHGAVREIADFVIRCKQERLTGDDA